MWLPSLSGTASDDIASAIETYKKGHPYKCDRDGIIDVGVGKVSIASLNLFFAFFNWRTCVHRKLLCFWPCLYFAAQLY